MSPLRGDRKRGRVHSFRKSSGSSLTLLALLAASPSAAETAQPPEGTQLPRVVVTSPPPSGRSKAGRPKQAVRPPAGPATPVTTPTTATTTPLNTNTVTEVGGPLGLTPRQTPATVEIVDQQLIKEQGYRTTTETAQGFPGVTAGDGPGAAANFSMRGFSGTQINTLYNGIKIGPSEMTNRIMDTYNLDRVEILKGPASLLSGEGATGGAVNYVTKAPHTGPIINESFTGWDSISGFRSGYGSGGSTNVKGLDYRFDISRTNLNSFIDDAYTKLFNVSGQLNYRVNDSFKVWGAAEYKEDRDRFYWGTPIVPANFPGIVPTSGIVSGRWTQNYPGPDFAGPKDVPLKPATIDARTLTTNYNVLDNKSYGKELWLRGGFEYTFDNNVTLRSQAYAYGARRYWHNNEISAFNDTDPAPGTFCCQVFGQVYRERLTVDHDQRTYGNITDLSWNNRIAGMENRSVVTLSAYRTQFNVAQDTVFGSDNVDLINPDRDIYGLEKDEHIRTRVSNVALSFEDRLKITPTFALIGGIRVEGIELSRIRFDEDGKLKAFYPFSKDFTPVTGRIGYTWEALPGVTFYSQYATGADPAVANIFILRPTDPLLLTTSRTYETGMKVLSWDKRAEFTFSLYDIERDNVYQSKSGHRVALAAKQHAKGVEFATAIRPTDEWKVFGNVALVSSKYENFVEVLDDGTQVDFTGKTPPNVPRIVLNAGTSYRFSTRWPVEVGGTVCHVGDRFNNDDNQLIMNAYTLFDAFAFVDVNPRDLGWQGVKDTRIGFRVRNLTDKKYAVWGDPGYPDQILLGAPRSFEVSAAFKW
jgi:iron complex outermembrane receptor protein